MDKLQIQGGTRLNGRIPISGAKNAALPLMCASLLTAEPVVLRRTPNLADVRTLQKLLNLLGVKSQYALGCMTLQADDVTSLKAPYELVSKMRASVLVLGPLLARFGNAEVSLPGGCAIGARPVDVLLNGLEALGATIDIEDGYIKASAPNGLHGADIHLPKPAVTGTENLMMAAVLAKGTTRIFNAAREPEIPALADCLNAMGAKVSGAGTEVISIEGVRTLHGTDIEVISDRIEAGTYLIAGALCATEGASVTVDGIDPSHNQALVEVLTAAGVAVDIGVNSYTVSRPTELKAVDVTTLPFPGFPTDLQAQVMLFLTQCNGDATVRETIYENRFMHALELKRMGAKISVEGQTSTVKGAVQLKGAEVMASDLRCSACLVLAGLIAKGQTTVSRIYHLDRGYERLEEKLNALGANIVRLSDTPSGQDEKLRSA